MCQRNAIFLKLKKYPFFKIRKYYPFISRKHLAMQKKYL